MSETDVWSVVPLSVCGAFSLWEPAFPGSQELQDLSCAGAPRGRAAALLSQ